MTDARILYDKLIGSHTVRRLDDQGHVLLYIDRQVLKEYTSPQAFSALRVAGRKVWRPYPSDESGDGRGRRGHRPSHRRAPAG